MINLRRTSLGIPTMPAQLLIFSWILAACGSNPLGGASQKVGLGIFATAPSEAPTISVQPGSSAILLSWNSVDRVGKYKIFRSTTSGSYQYASPIGTSTTNSYADLTATNGTTYFYEVRASNNMGDAASSNEVSGKAIAAFSVSSAVASATQTLLNFGSALGADTYTVKYGTAPGVYSSTASTSATSPYSLTGLTPGTTYYLRVTGVNTVGPGNEVNSSVETVVRPVGAFSISGVSPTSGTVTVSFGSATGATAYVVRYGTSSGSYPITFTTNATSPTTVTGLTPNTTYYFMVEASNALNGFQAASSELNVTTQNGPAPPTGLTATAGTSNVALAWNSIPDATSYTVFRSTTSGSGYAALPSCSSIGATACTDLTALNGITYYYVVRSEGGGAVSDFSAEVSAMPISSFSIASAVVSNAGGPEAVVLNWGAATGASDYTITWGTGGSATGVGSTTTASTSATIGSLTAGTAYTFRVTATNTVGSGASIASSNTRTATPMTRPVISSITQTGAGQAFLVWTSGTGSTGSNVTYGISSGSYPSTAATGAASPYTLTGLTPGTDHYVMVTATNSSGSLDALPEVSLLVLDTPLAPTGVTATGGPSSITITWNDSANASSYTVYRSMTSGSGYAALASCSGISTPTCTDTTASAGTVYYVVRASNIGGTSGYSSEASTVYSPSIAVGFADKDGNARTGFTILPAASGTNAVAAANTTAIGSKIHLTKRIGANLTNADPTCTVTIKTYSLSTLTGSLGDHFVEDQTGSGSYVITMNSSIKEVDPAIFNVRASTKWVNGGSGTSPWTGGDRYFVARIDSTTCGVVGTAKQAQVNLIDRTYRSTTIGHAGAGDFMLSESFYTVSPGTGDSYATVTIQRPFFNGAVASDSSVRVIDLLLEPGSNSARGTDYATGSPVIQYTHMADNTTVGGGGTGIADLTTKYAVTFNANETEKEIRIPVASSGANKSFFVRIAPHAFTANLTEGSTLLSSVSDYTDLATGQVISGPGIQGGTSITVSGATVTLSKPAAYTASGVSLVTNRAGYPRSQSVAKIRILNTSASDTTTSPILRTSAVSFYNSTGSCYTGAAITPSGVVTASGTSTMTVSSTAGITNGMPIAGANIPAKTYVTVANATTLNLINESGGTQNATGTASQTAQIYAFGGGDGTASKPYLICNSTHWANMVHATRCSGGSCNGSTLFFKLMADFEWGSAPASLSGFRANLDGNQYMIQGYGVSGATAPGASPLFSAPGAITSLSSTVLKNLNLVHSMILYSGSQWGMGTLYSRISGSGFTFSDLFVSGFMNLSGSLSGNSRAGFLFGLVSSALTGNTIIDHVMTAGTFSTQFSTNSSGIGGYYSIHVPGAGTTLSITDSYSTLDLLVNNTGTTFASGGILGQYSISTTAIITGGINFNHVHSTGLLWTGGGTTNPGFGGILGALLTQATAVTSGSLIPNSFTNMSFSGSIASTQHNTGGLIGRISVTAAGQSVVLEDNVTNGSVNNYNTISQYHGGLIGRIVNETVTSHSALSLNRNIVRGEVRMDSGSTSSNIGGLAGAVEVGNTAAGAGLVFEASRNHASGAVKIASTSTGAAGPNSIGGLIGQLSWAPTPASGIFSKNGATGDVSCTTAASCGGLVGLLIGAPGDAAGSHLVDSCYATGNVTSSETASSLTVGTGHGGFAGIVRDGIHIYKSFATGNWTDSASHYLVGYGSGGFAGELGANTTIEKSYSTGTVTALGATGEIGGFVGRIVLTSDTATSDIIQSWSSGSVSGTSATALTASGVGGFIGYVSGGIVTIDRSFAAGASVAGNLSANSKTSGFIGMTTTASTSSLEVKNSYSAASSVTGLSSTGFLTGLTNTAVCYTSSYYLHAGTSGGATATGSGTLGAVNCSGTSATQTTAATLRNPASAIFSDAGWDSNFSSGTPSWVAPTNGAACTWDSCPSASYFYPTVYW